MTSRWSGSRAGSRACGTSWPPSTRGWARRSARARCWATISPPGCAPPSPSTSRSLADGEAPRAAPADQVRPEHPQDHQDDGARGHVEAQARAGPCRDRAPVRRRAGRGDRRPLLPRAGRAVSAAAPAEGWERERPAGRAAADHVEPRVVRRVQRQPDPRGAPPHRDRKSTRLNSSHDQISYAVFCLKKKKKTKTQPPSMPNSLHQTTPQIKTLTNPTQALTSPGKNTHQSKSNARPSSALTHNPSIDP